jgi:hypothetical protein
MPKAREMTEADVAEFQRRFSYDSDTGILTNKISFHPNSPIGAEAGAWVEGRDGWRCRVRVNQALWVHTRIIYALVSGEPTPSNRHVDHIDGRTFNNIWSNLRLATPGENQHNRRKSRGNTSGVTGVSWWKDRSKWRAQLKVGGKNRYFGSFDTKEEAAHARRLAERKYHKEFRASAGVSRT